MSYRVPNPQQIQTISDHFNYLEGMRLASTGKVSAVHAGSKQGQFSATVKGSDGAYHTSVTITLTTVSVLCSCSKWPPVSPCPHGVALLLTINDLSQSGSLSITPKPSSVPPSVPGTHHLTKRLLGAFRQASRPDQIAIAASQELVVEFGLTAVSERYQPRLALSLKIGTKRVQYIPKIREFLNDILGQNTYPLSKTFTYDPKLHVFSTEVTEFLSELQMIVRKGNLVETSTHYHGFSHDSRHRYLVIPPLAFERIKPLLQRVRLLLRHETLLEISQSHLPIDVTLGAADQDSYHLNIAGFKNLDIFPAYGAVLAGSTLHFLDEVLTEQLYQMKNLAGSHTTIELPASRTDIEAIMEHVVPVLRKVATVTIDKSIQDKVIDTPFHGTIYLDYQNDALLAQVKFQYGAATLDALAPSPSAETAETIIIRDTGHEEELLRHLYVSGFEVSGRRLWLRDEASLFAFLTDELPELRQRYTVYLTEALEPMMRSAIFSPKASVDLTVDMNWLEVNFDMDDIDPKEVRQVLKSLIEKRPYHRLKSGAFLGLEQPGFKELGGLLTDLDVGAKDVSKDAKLRVPALRGITLMDQSGRTSSVALGKSLRRFIDDLIHPDNLDVAPPPSLTGVLRDYQRFGFEWMTTLTRYNFGGILADDMGLGKTLQSIAFLLSEREKGPFKSPALIICPASLMYNWGHEITRFAPALETRIVAGNREEREAILKDSSGVDVLITSYPILRRDSDLYTDRNFHALIIDEAQAIKNHATQTAQSVAALHSNKRFALTGTPIENSLDDLWSILNAVFPTLFSNREAFRRMSPETVARRVRPFILRRLKKDVLKELPDKIETVESADLTSHQKKIYLAYLEQLRKDTVDELSESDFQKNRFKILAGLTRLRQICCHPGMFTENYEGGSGKLDLLLEIVDEALSANKRMLIFSQFTSMLAIIEEALQERHSDYFYLDGDTPVKDRLELTQKFNQGERPIFLISLKAGGTGLNLTGADTVILYDLWWNPAVEEQAADRAHRIGQRNVVQVIRLLTEGTIEEKMYALQQKKRDLIHQVINANDEGLESLSEEDVRQLLAL